MFDGLGLKFIDATYMPFICKGRMGPIQLRLKLL